MFKRIRLFILISISITISYCKDPFGHVEPRIVQKLYQTLLDVHDFFTTNNISYFIDSGTLLGAVRHRGLIPWGDDFKTIKPLEPLVHNIQPKITIPQWPVDFMDKYPKAKE